MTPTPLAKNPGRIAPSLARLALCLGLCAAIAAVGGATTAPQIGSWYASLAKPAFTPPNGAFPIVWPALYGLIAVALWRLWDRAPASPQRRAALLTLGANLALNALWSPVFFGLHATKWGLAIILAMIATLVAAIIGAARADRLAAALLAPYLAWIVFAAALNAEIVRLNP
ncbi:TspO/MBR family protein [Methylocella sp.]|uniref:TspO/MBR family protein n=1 Tax=Methylocella sp. TaxID=1978226 RepID=UPI0037837540